MKTDGDRQRAMRRGRGPAPTFASPLSLRLSPRRRTGAVMVITILALLLLAALVFYVINLGQQVNARVVTQHSADSGAIATAGYVARAFNTVAMNNVAISRNLAVVNTLDAYPAATAGARDEQTAFYESLHGRLDIASPWPELNRVARDEFEQLDTTLEREVAFLEQMHTLLRDNDVRELTHYNGPAGRGHLWRAMEAMDQLSQASMESLEKASEFAGLMGGAANLPPPPDSASFTVLGEVPWVRGRFDDFEMPVTRGRLPAGVDHEVTNRGPYDTVFGWRRYQRSDDDPWVIPGGSGGGGSAVSGVDTGGAGSPFGGGPGNSGGGGGPRVVGRPVAYDTYGTQDYILGLWNHETLCRSRFYPFLHAMSWAKLRYAWPGSDPRYFATPHWDRAYPPVLSTDSPLPLSETGYVRLDIKSRVAPGQTGFMNPGTWSFSPAARGSTPCSASHAVLVRHRGWWLPPNPNPGLRLYMNTPEQLPAVNPSLTVVPAGDRTWVLWFSYRVTSDSDLGLSPRFDSQGRPQPYTVQFVQVVVYAGINRNLEPPLPLLSSDTGDDVLVANPYAGLNRASAPAPIDLNHSLAGPSPASRRSYFTAFAAVRQTDRALLWPSRFSGAKPYPNTVGIAQAKVFNDHSWDLWTQAWHAELEPVTGYGEWVDRLVPDVASVMLSNQESAEAEYEQMKAYLRSLDSLAPVMLNH